MALMSQDKKTKRSRQNFPYNESTLRCVLCKVLFPIEYMECPNCNMLK